MSPLGKCSSQIQVLMVLHAFNCLVPANYSRSSLTGGPLSKTVQDTFEDLKCKMVCFIEQTESYFSSSNSQQFYSSTCSSATPWEPAELSMLFSAESRGHLGQNRFHLRKSSSDRVPFCIYSAFRVDCARASSSVVYDGVIWVPI